MCLHDARLISQALTYWYKRYFQKILLRNKFNTLRETSIQKRITSTFAKWIVLYETKKNCRANFFKGRAHKLETIAITHWKKYTRERAIFKAKMLGFLKLRANNLLGIAMGVIFKFAKQHEMKRKLNKVAAFIFLEKNLKKCYGSLKYLLTLKRKS